MSSSKRRAGTSPKEGVGRRNGTTLVPAVPASKPIVRLRRLDGNVGLKAGRIEVIAWIAVAAVALGVRLINLDGAPLQPGESALAMDSWRILHHDGVQISSNPLLIYVNTVMFLVLGATDAVARAMPCLFGVAVALSPVFLRNQLGRAGAVIAATVLATSPTLVFASRNVDPTIITTGLGLGLVLVTEHYLRFRRQAYLMAGAVLVGLMLMSGPLAYDLLIVLVSFVVVYGSEDVRAEWIRLSREEDSLAKDVRWGDDPPRDLAPARSPRTLTSIAIALASTVVLVGAGLGTNLEGIGLSLAAPLADWAASISGPGVHPAWLYPALVIGYEPAALVFGIAGVVIAFRESRPFGIFLGWWATIGFLLLVVSGGHPTWNALVVIPLALLAGMAADRLPSMLVVRAESRRLAIFVAAVFPLIATTLIAFGYVTLPDPIVPREVAIAPPLALIALIVSFGLGFDWRSALRATGVAALICLVAFNVHATMLLNPGGALNPAELFVGSATSPDVRQMASDLATITDELNIAQQIEGRPVNQTIEVSRPFADPLRWYLRSDNDVRVVDQVSDSPGVAIVAAAAKPPKGAYAGETFQFSESVPPPSLSPGKLWRWWMYHEAESRTETYVKVYVKTQLARP